MKAEHNEREKRQQLEKTNKTKTNKKMKKATIKTINKKDKKLPTITCPTCGATITRDDLGYAQQGTMFYDVWFNKDGSPHYEQIEFEAKDSGEFYHWECGGLSLTDEQLKQLGVKLN